MVVIIMILTFFIVIVIMIIVTFFIAIVIMIIMTFFIMMISYVGQVRCLRRWLREMEARIDPLQVVINYLLSIVYHLFIIPLQFTMYHIVITNHLLSIYH